MRGCGLIAGVVFAIGAMGSANTAFADQLAPAAILARPTTTIDDLGFSKAMNEEVFAASQSALSDTYRIRNTTAVHGSESLLTGDPGPATSTLPLTVSSMVDLQSAQTAYSYRSRASGLVLDTRYAGLAGYEDQTESDSLNVRRFSTAINSESGTLTVGNDWSNFQDFLGQPGFGDQTSNLPLGSAFANTQNGIISEQVQWQSASDAGSFSIAVENNLASTLDADLSAGTDQQSGYSSSPNLVVSWQGGNPNGSQYRVAAIGSQLESDGNRIPSEADDDIGWGLNLAGGWRFGDLFTALSVTLGNSIDSFILGNLGNSETAAAAKIPGQGESFNINPSLNYQFGESSNLHFSLNRYHSSAGSTAHGVDTLDTVHLGYSWNPWPSTRFGVEFVGKDVKGGDKMDDSSAVNFAASKEF